MKCISWNVNGIRAVLKKDFVEILYALDADIFCIQETKAQPDQIEVDCELYPYQYINSAQKKGYSGTMIFCKEEPLSIRYGMNMEEHDTEGRVITLEYPEYYVVTVYTPNSGDGLKRLDYRMEWDKVFSAYLKSLDKPVMACGDFNVANEEIDIKKDGKDILIGFNPKFLIDALRVIDDEEVDIYMINPKAPCFIKDKNETYIYLILPVNFNASAN